MSVVPLRPGMPSAAARALTDKLKTDAENLWRGLLDAYERGAHTALGYKSWAAYFKAEFGAGSSQAYRMLDAGRVSRAIESHSPHGEHTPLKSEKVARTLAPVLHTRGERAVAETWADVVEEHGPDPSVEEVEAVVDQKPKQKLTTEQQQFDNNLSGMLLAAEYLIGKLNGRTIAGRTATARLLAVDEATREAWLEEANVVRVAARKLERHLKGDHR